MFGKSTRKLAKTVEHQVQSSRELILNQKEILNSLSVVIESYKSMSDKLTEALDIDRGILDHCSEITDQNQETNLALQQDLPRMERQIIEAINPRISQLVINDKFKTGDKVHFNGEYGSDPNTKLIVAYPLNTDCVIVFRYEDIINLNATNVQPLPCDNGLIEKGWLEDQSQS